MARILNSEQSQKLLRASCDDSQEEDRLSTAAPSICEETATRWADLADLENELASPCKAPLRWADLVDEDSELPKAPAKARWADLSESSDEECLPSSWTEPAPSDSAWTTVSRKPPSTPAWESRDRAWTGAGTGHKGKAGGKGKSAGKGVGKASEGRGGKASEGKGKADGKGKAAGKGAKCQCQFTIGIEEDNRFRVCRRLLGPAGQHMKEVAERTGAKLRLRGRGSKFLEGPEKKESKDPLMLCLSAPSPAAYQEAKKMVSDLLESVYTEYRDFHKKEGSVEVRLDIHEGPRPGSF